MQITNEVRAKIFAAYMPCKIVDSEGEYRLAGLSFYSQDMHVDLNGRDDWWNLTANYRLLLKPLSAITDEHAIIVYKILEFAEATPEFMAHKGKWHAKTARNTAVTDQLREWGYNVGYGRPYTPEQLILANLATDATI